MTTFVQNDLRPDIIKTINPRIGLIALSTDFTIEQDYRNICHQLPVDIFVNRIPFENPLNHENYLKMAHHISDVSAQILPSEDVDIVAYGCTSGTIAIGAERIKQEVNNSKPNAKVTTPITAAIKAFNYLGIKKIAVLTPYPKDVNETVFNYLNENNLTILRNTPKGKQVKGFSWNEAKNVPLKKGDEIIISKNSDVLSGNLHPIIIAKPNSR